MSQQDIAVQRKEDTQKADETTGKSADKTSTAVQRREDSVMRRWDPVQMFDDMQREMLRFFGPRSPFGSWLPFQGNRAHLTSGAVWAPSVDVYEQGNNIVVKAELPGVKKEDIEVELDQGSLILRGQRQEEKEVRDEQYYRSERTYGSFYRRIPVPEGIKPDQINASFKDGLLEVRLPKPQEPEPKRQKINVR